MAEYKLPENPAWGEMRFVKREVGGRELRILQVFKSTWGQEDEDNDVIGVWYDVPLVEDDVDNG